MERRRFIVRHGEDPAHHLGQLRAQGWRLEWFRTATGGSLCPRPPGPARPDVAELCRREVVTVLGCVREAQG